MGRSGRWWMGLALVGEIGCGAHGHFSNWEWSGKHAAFKIGALPQQWQRAEGGADVEFFAPDTGAVIMANAQCTDIKDSPLKVLSNTLLFGFTELHFQSQQLVPLADREAMHSIADAKLDGVPVTVESYVLKKDGCVFDLDYAAPPQSFERGRRDFHDLVAGFATVRT